VPNFVTIAKTVAEIWRFFDFLRWWPPPSGIFFKFRNSSGLNAKRAKLRHCAKFRGDWSNCCGDIAIFPFFQGGGSPPSWICDAHV